MRPRARAGRREVAALHDVPDDLVARCQGAVESGEGFSLGLRCEILDAYDRARLLGARSEAVAELLSVSNTTLLTRWRRERQRWMRAIDVFRGGMQCRA